VQTFLLNLLRLDLRLEYCISLMIQLMHFARQMMRSFYTHPNRSGLNFEAFNNVLNSISSFVKKIQEFKPKSNGVEARYGIRADDGADGSEREPEANLQ
jgi:hypothetical protein